MIVCGPDDICAPLLSDSEPHCWSNSVTERDRLAAHAISELLARPIKVGTTLNLDPTSLTKMRERFAIGDIREACTRCEWSTLCTAIASDDFDGTRL